jgi:hypothetical protein
MISSTPLTVPFFTKELFLKADRFRLLSTAKSNTLLGSLTYLCLIYYADFKRTWISIHARAAGQSRPYLENFSDFEHGLGENLSAR